MDYVFGPVPSRRLGQSLGIDPVPFKTCNWNCVYCQLGRTAPLALERREYVSVDAVLTEVAEALDRESHDAIDWLTFAGSGEPTLNSGIGRMIRGVQAITAVPVAVLTNGSLLHLPEVRQELSTADAVLPTLDAGNEGTYRRVNRAARSLDFETYVAGLIAFRREYRGRMPVEVMLVAGLNDTDAELGDLAVVLDRIRPDEVHVNVAVRPPAESWVEPVSDERVERATAILGKRARKIAAPNGEFGSSGMAEVADAIVAVVMRHPMSHEELVRTLGRWSPGEVEQAAARLAGDGRLRAVERGGRRFWCFGGGRYRDGGGRSGR